MRFLVLLLTAIMGFSPLGSERVDCVALDSGSVNRVEVGELLCIRVSENQTTPYRWEYAVSGDGLIELEYDEYKTDPNPRNMVGIGGTHTFYFRATQPGTCTLRMHEVRIGEGVESAVVSEAYEIVIEAGLFSIPIEEWTAGVDAALKNAGLPIEEPFTFHEISAYLRYYEMKLDGGLVVIRLAVTGDMLPHSVSIEMDYTDEELGAQEREEGIALMQAALLACIAATDPTMQAARAGEITDALGEWAREALARGVDMGHDEREGRYYYSAMNDTHQRSADFYIHRYPVYEGSFFDGMDTGALMYEE